MTSFAVRSFPAARGVSSVQTSEKLGNWGLSTGLELVSERSIAMMAPMHQFAALGLGLGRPRGRCVRGGGKCPAFDSLSLSPWLVSLHLRSSGI